MQSVDPTTWLVTQGSAAALIAARVAGLAWTAPVWGTTGIGWRIRLGLVLFLTALLFPLVGPELQIPTERTALARSCVVELVTGLALGLSISLVLSAARQAGELVGLQAGLSTASLYDPEAGGEMTVLGHLYGLVALGTFIAIGGPVELVGSLVESYRAVPVGWLELGPDHVAAAFARIGWALALSLRAAAPAGLALVLSSLALGLVMKASPSLQVANLALPVRTGIAVLLVLAGLTGLVAVFSTVWWSVLELTTL